MTQPSSWQKSIEGEWHGLPSIFDAEGNHVGYNKVYRSSNFDRETGKTIYLMNTRLEENRRAAGRALRGLGYFRFRRA